MFKINFRSLLVIPLALLSGSVLATTLTIDLDTEFSGATAPVGSTPWITATFNDFDSPGSVQLTMSATNLTDSEIIGKWLFNLDTALDPTLLTITYASGLAATTASSGANAFKADGAGYFDIEFDFPPPGTLVFVDGLTSVYTITSSEAITADSFNQGSTLSSKGSFDSAAHIQRIGSEDNDSGWIRGNTEGGGGGEEEIPEPGVLALLGAGLLAGLLARRRRYH